MAGEVWRWVNAADEQSTDMRAFFGCVRHRQHTQAKFLNAPFLLVETPLPPSLLSLQEDVEDLRHLIGFLEKEYGAEEVVLLGHSTGCQQCVKFLEGKVGIVKGAILQGPVSDRETDEDNGEWVKLSERMVGEGNGEEFLPRKAFWAPITARR